MDFLKKAFYINLQITVMAPNQEAVDACGRTVLDKYHMRIIIVLQNPCTDPFTELFEKDKKAKLKDNRFLFLWQVVSGPKYLIAKSDVLQVVSFAYDDEI